MFLMIFCTWMLLLGVESALLTLITTLYENKEVFFFLNRHVSFKKTKKHMNFSVILQNILADTHLFCEAQIHDYCDTPSSCATSKYLHWKRKKMEKNHLNKESKKT